MKILLYVLLASFLFSLLDWKVIQFTRLNNREWLDWMHAHEQQYAAVTRTAETILCTPAMALKPIFYYAIMRAETNKEQRDAITHAPPPTWAGFYHLPVRGQPWKFVSWFAWFGYWLAPSFVWGWIAYEYMKYPEGGSGA